MDTSTPEGQEVEAPNYSLLASQVFGDGFKGEVQEQPVEEPQQPQEAAEEETQPEVG